MAITKMDDLVFALVAGDVRTFNKAAVASLAAGQRHSLWNVSGNPGAAATPPTGNGGIPTSATAGAIPFVNAGAGGNNYLGFVAASAGQSGSLILYDRIYHNSGMSATTTGAGTALSPAALTRATNGIGVEAWIQIYTAFGAATAATLTLTYTDQDGNTGQTGTIAKPASAGDVGEMWGPMAFASGDYGVRAITNYSWSATQTSGDFGLVLVKKIITIPMATTNVPAVFNAFSSGLREIEDGACLALMTEVNATTMGPILGELTVAKG
jgi:hypothetical protein